MPLFTPFLDHWAHAGTAVVSAFLASLVEFVEALTIVLAVGMTRGWRSALLGAVAGTLFLATLTVVFGPALQQIPLARVQTVVGILLLLFGMRWLRKAILRAGGVIGLHDEAASYAKATTRLALEGSQASAIDRLGFVTSFKAVTLEGLEVIFIVIATGAGGQLGAAGFGAALAGLVVIAAGFALHRPLTRVPENTLKLCVGVLLSAFGVFWFGEGMSFSWPGDDLALIGLIAGFALTALGSTVLIRRIRRARATP